MTERGCHRMSVEWKDFVKTAYAVKGNMFRLDKGEAPGLVAKAHKIPVGDLLAANPGVKANKYVAGKWYRMPSPAPAPRASQAAPAPRPALAPQARPNAAQSGTRHVVQVSIPQTPGPVAQTRPRLTRQQRANNIYNMRHYRQGWQGEVSDGLSKGDFLGFATKWHGARAGMRNIRTLLNRLASQGRPATMRNLIPIFSPSSENDVGGHIRNTSFLSGISPDQDLGRIDDETMFRLATGLAMAESGRGALRGLSQKGIMDAVQASKRSQ